jgi:hypothetical protein
MRHSRQESSAQSGALSASLKTTLPTAISGAGEVEVEVAQGMRASFVKQSAAFVHPKRQRRFTN